MKILTRREWRYPLERKQNGSPVFLAFNCEVRLPANQMCSAGQCGGMDDWLTKASWNTWIWRVEAQTARCLLSRLFQFLGSQQGQAYSTHMGQYYLHWQDKWVLTVTLILHTASVVANEINLNGRSHRCRLSHALRPSSSEASPTAISPISSVHFVLLNGMGIHLIPYEDRHSHLEYP